MAVACRVQVFARAPVSGKVKTRLIPRLGAEAAARLQMKLTSHAVATAIASELGPVELWCSPDISHPSFAALSQQGVALRDQGGGDLGERMHRALSSAILNGEFAVLIGSDCPCLTPHDLRCAAQALRDGADLAFVPAEDGGYVLIAARSCSHQLFDDIAWGSEHVMAQTRSRLRELGQTWQELPPRWDIDRPEDYDRLLREHPKLLSAPA
ncbi:MAG: TIGR04282 family arsenosugar biosynthesis glycosyltransferase [Betaproteobacteria bacterium]|nr:MAG: TIGR04282 family arsenosugar biosynthesis glycosyltransferase [Betaproteobacteria bacterium]